MDTTSKPSATLLERRLLQEGPVTAIDFRCRAGPRDRPYVEMHTAWSVGYVRRGTFSCTCGGKHYDLVPGSLLLGRPGDEFSCAHEHHTGDQCVAFFFDPELLDDRDVALVPWRSGALPPLRRTATIGALLEQALGHGNGLGLDEIGMTLLQVIVAELGAQPPRRSTVRAQDERRIVEMALYMSAHSEEEFDLNQLAAQAGMKPFAFLRAFSARLGVTPHQYLIHCRLRRAALLLLDSDLEVTEVALEAGYADLSHFVRTFHRAAGRSPRAFRGMGRRQGLRQHLRQGLRTAPLPIFEA